MVENISYPCGEVEKLHNSSLLDEILLTLSNTENVGKFIPLKLLFYGQKRDIKKTLSHEEKNKIYDIINKGQICLTFAD